MRYHRNIRILTIMISLLLLAAFAARSEPMGIDPNIPDTIYVDSIVSTSSSNGFVPIYFFNDEELAGIEVTLNYQSPDLFIDSFSFVGGRLEAFSLKGTQQFPNAAITLYSYSLSEALLQPGTGLMGYLFFSYTTNIQPQIVPIDTITISDDGEKEFSSTFSDASANMFKPEFVMGYLDIQPTNCCLGDRGNVDSSPDDVTDIDDMVYLVNFAFKGGPRPSCDEESNIDGSLDGIIDVDDLVYMVNFVFKDGPPPSSCP